jgi:hypothetical protein
MARRGMKRDAGDDQTLYNGTAMLKASQSTAVVVVYVFVYYGVVIARFGESAEAQAAAFVATRKATTNSALHIASMYVSHTLRVMLPCWWSHCLPCQPTSHKHVTASAGEGPLHPASGAAAS